MRPQLLKVSREPGHSFSVRRDLVPYVNNRWHFHADVELIHFEKGKGSQFVGDSMRRFISGDVVLVGANLPHYWRFDDPYFEDDHDTPTDVRVAHFGEHFWSGSFIDLPENIPLKSLLDKAKRGLQIQGEAKKKLAFLLERLLDPEGMPRLLLLMEALQVPDAQDLFPLNFTSFYKYFKLITGKSPLGYQRDFVSSSSSPAERRRKKCRA